MQRILAALLLVLVLPGILLILASCAATGLLLGSDHPGDDCLRH